MELLCKRKAPKLLSCCGIRSGQGSAVIAKEHKSAGCGKRASPSFARAKLRQLPRYFSGFNIERAQEFLWFVVWITPSTTAYPSRAA